MNTLLALIVKGQVTPEQSHQMQIDQVDRALGITWSMVGVASCYALVTVIVILLLSGPIRQSFRFRDKNDSDSY